MSIFRVILGHQAAQQPVLILYLFPHLTGYWLPVATTTLNNNPENPLV